MLSQEVRTIGSLMVALCSLSWEPWVPLSSLPSLAAAPATQECHCAVLGTVEGEEVTQLWPFLSKAFWPWLLESPRLPVSSQAQLQEDSCPLLPPQEMAQVSGIGSWTPQPSSPPAPV